MATVFICFYASLCVTGKKNMLSLLSVIFVLCNRVQSSKITSSEQNIFSLVDKMFQHVSVLFSRLIDRFFTYLLNINIMET